MDTVEKIPLKNEEQILAEKTGGISADPIGVTRKAVAENLGKPIEEVTPDTEIADAGIGNFLKDVVHVEEEKSGNPKLQDLSPTLSGLGEGINALLPQIGEDTSGNDRVASSGPFSELVKKREAA